MLEITYTTLVILITAAWIIACTAVSIKNKRLNVCRELALLTVYICIIVVARFTFFPFRPVNGVIQPLIFDLSTAFPPKINLIPLVFLFDYEVFREALINVIGNTTMFIPIGIVWPSVFKRLDTHGKVIAAGVGFSLIIEILQLPFSDRVSDIDDLLLNSLGYICGYAIYLLVIKICQKGRKSK